MNRLPSSVLAAVAVAIALLTGVGELLALQAWRLRDRLARPAR
jgi:hypothetical protein